MWRAGGQASGRDDRKDGEQEPAVAGEVLEGLLPVRDCDVHGAQLCGADNYQVLRFLVQGEGR